MDPSSTTVAVDPRHIGYTNVMYALHAASLVVGIVTTASIAGRFVFGLPSIVAVIMNYVRRGEVRGTWLDTHFGWQLRTFWIAAALLVCSWPLALTIILIPVVYGVYAIVGLWAVYRVARGWLALREGRAMPMGGW